jgi:hypothetical protein
LTSCLSSKRTTRFGVVTSLPTQPVGVPALPALPPLLEPAAAPDDPAAPALPPPPEVPPDELPAAAAVPPGFCPSIVVSQPATNGALATTRAGAKTMRDRKWAQCDTINLPELPPD